MKQNICNVKLNLIPPHKNNLSKIFGNFDSNLYCILGKFYIGLSLRTKRRKQPASLYVLKKTKKPTSEDDSLYFLSMSNPQTTKFRRKDSYNMKHLTKNFNNFTQSFIDFIGCVI